MGPHPTSEKAVPIENESAAGFAEHQFAQALAVYDEALAVGQPPPSALAALPAAERQRLDEARAVLHLLDQIHPRSLASVAPANETPSQQGSPRTSDGLR